MAYTYRDAIETAYKYLGINKKTVRIIDNTNGRGIVYSFEGEEIVVFIYPISCKQNNKQNFFDTRDSGAKERATTWQYAIDKGLRYFCFGFNEEQDRYSNYILSLESDENSISNISFRKSTDSSATGTQVNIPADFIPQSKFERIITPKGFYIAAIHKDHIAEYIRYFDNRPYLTDHVDYLDDESEDEQNPVFNTGINSPFARNRIIFGAPGTGKSYRLNKERKELVGEDNETDYERVTFHPDYSYANFVGTYKPVMVSNRKTAADKDTDYVISILNDEGKTAQEKYDVLFDRFKDGGLTRLPVLLGLYTDEIFKTRKQDGTDATGDYSVERNLGKAIRKYVSLLTGQESSSDIAYEYVPGPFMRVYVNALKSARTDNPKPYLLIIEEINRANVAAVFGDIFQLLDRGEDEVSEYPIQASEDIKKYLAKELGGKPEDYNKIKIPDNMFIWATMNSADQGVFPMDTAFKRRWDFTYIGIDDNDDEIQGKYVILGNGTSQKVEWNKLRKAINRFLAKQKINEDKQLGPYFLSRKIVIPESGDEIDRDRFCEAFKNKVIMYLFEDAAKQKRPSLFEGCFDSSSRYSEICKEFDEKGVGIFNHEIGLDTDPEDIKINGTEAGETAEETE